jgi:hypothetical protein
MQQFEADFRARLQAGDDEELVMWVKEQVLQSYRNGLAARSQPAAQEKGRAWKPRKQDGQR